MARCLKLPIADRSTARACPHGLAGGRTSSPRPRAGTAPVRSRKRWLGAGGRGHRPTVGPHAGATQSGALTAHVFVLSFRHERPAGFTYAVVDTPPAITDAIRAVVALADLVLIPVKPSPHDLRAVGRIGKAFCFVLTQAKGNALLTVQAMAALSEHGVVSPAVMHDRVDYASSMTDGRTVQEADPKGRSAAEMANLWQFVKTRMHESKNARKAAE